MKHAWRSQAVVMAASALALAACDTTQPDRISGRTGSLTVQAGAAAIELLECYEIWQDLEPAGMPDGVPETFLQQSQCFETGRTAAKPVPWHYSLAVTIIPAGSTTEQLVISRDGVVGTTIGNGELSDDFISMTDFDPDVPPSILRPPLGDIYFLNGKEVSRGSPVYLGAFSASCPSCPIDLGAANVLTGPASFDFDVNSGDTIIVRARKQRYGDSAGYIPADPNPQLRISATLAIGGVPVAVNGTSDSPNEDGTGFAFSFTVQ